MVYLQSAAGLTTIERLMEWRQAKTLRTPPSILIRTKQNCRRTLRTLCLCPFPMARNRRNRLSGTRAPDQTPDHTGSITLSLSECMIPAFWVKAALTTPIAENLFPLSQDFKATNGSTSERQLELVRGPASLESYKVRCEHGASIFV